MQERLASEASDSIATRLDLETALAGLTPKQHACARLVMQGYTYQEIAEALAISVPRVQQHVAMVQKKLKPYFPDRS